MTITIQHTFQHINGIGPVNNKKLHDNKIFTWDDVQKNCDNLPFSNKLNQDILKHTNASITALARNNISYFVNAFKPIDHWKILQTYINDVTYFDIETSGLSAYNSDITVLIVLHKGKIFQFIKNENIDDCLELFEDCKLLVSFNGNCFDVPFILRSFNIPELPCPHIDLRWVCYHKGLTGGLKSIEKKLHIIRPDNLTGIDGTEAVILWNQWIIFKDKGAKDRLINYCIEDVYSLQKISRNILL